MSSHAARRAAALAEMEMRRRRAAAQAVDAAAPGGIPEGMGFRAWCEDLGRRGLKVDRKPFRLDDRPALIPIYDAIPATRAEAAGRTIVIQKATQLGLTVWEVLADIFMAKKWGPVNIGLFLPDQATASFKSSQRFMPIVRSDPLLHREVMERPAGEGGKGGEGNILTRQFGQSLLMFMWTSGKMSTESRPMDVVSLDEVQGMSLDEIDKVFARTGDSEVGFKLLLSTANEEKADINAWYLRGTQEVWHTECRACGALSDLSDPEKHFPDASIGHGASGRVKPTVGEDGRSLPPPDDYCWTCPECSAWIPDAQRGRYVAQNPHADPNVQSLLLPRTISPRITPRKMLTDFRHALTGAQRKSFHNRQLARPFINLDERPVTLAHCEAAVAEGRRMGLAWETEAKPGESYYCGIDQMGGWNALVIKKRLPDGRQGVVHVEATYAEAGGTPFGRASELMERFRVSVCVVELNPNSTEARNFAHRHPGRVFINSSFAAHDMLVWSDQLDRSQRRTASEAVVRYELAINQFQLMESSLHRITKLGCLFPDPDALVQEVRTEQGRPRIPILRDWVFTHLTKVALVVEHDEETRRPRPVVRKPTNLDPHFAFANMLCDAAWAREQGTGTIILPEPKADPSGPLADLIPLAAPGSPLAAPLARFVAETMAVPGSCGACQSFDASSGKGHCTERAMATGAAEPACPLFVGKGR